MRHGINAVPGHDRVVLLNRSFVFRIVQELVNNVFKHSNAGFIHLTQNNSGSNMYFRLHHDGTGIVQADFEKIEPKRPGSWLKKYSQPY